MKKKHFGELFYSARFHFDLTQTDVARELKVSQSKLSKMESDRLEPSASEFLWLVQRLLNVDVLAEINVALEPARQKIVQLGHAKDHREKLHKVKPDEDCNLCKADKEAARLTDEKVKQRQEELGKQIGRRVQRLVRT